MRTKTAVATTATLTLLTGCGNGADDTAAAPPASETTSAEASKEPSKPKDPDSSEPTEEVVITIEEFMYSELEPVAPGAEITVENTDGEAHTLTAEGDGDFDITIAPGESETLTTPDEAGEYPYVCTFHAGMTATLRVA